MTSSIVHKVWMAVTGLFLVVFLAVHMAGNLQLFLPESSARPAFNGYSALLTSNPFIKVAGWLTYLSVVVHTVLAARVSVRNRRARRRGYAIRATSSPWYTRSMGWLGTVVLLFLVWHLQMFWYRYHWGPIGLDAEGNKDLYAVVVASFAQPGIVALYVVCMVALGFHLQHGVAAAVRSVGVFGAGASRWAERGAVWIAWGLVIPFALMPVYVYLTAGGPTS